MDAEPTNESSYLTESSPAVLEPSKDESRRERSQSLLERILSGSRRQTSSETAPLIPRVGPQVSEPVNCCTALFNCYSNSVVKFRNSAFICVLQVLFCLVPVSAIVMGALFLQNCPKTSFLPGFGGAVGLLGVIFIVFWMLLTTLDRRGLPCSFKQKLACGVVGFLVLNMTIVDAVLVFSLSPSPDPSAEDYCSPIFYSYAFYKELVTLAIALLSALLYLPESRHTLCCQDCSMHSPANVFYRTI